MGKVIDSLINQFSQQNNYLFQKRNTDNQLETNLESVESKESVKLKETEKITNTANNNKTEDTGERENEKNPEANIRGFFGFFNSNICTTSKRKKITLKRKKSPGSPN